MSDDAGLQSRIMFPQAIGVGACFGLFTAVFGLFEWYLAAGITGIGAAIFLGTAIMAQRCGK